MIKVMNNDAEYNKTQLLENLKEALIMNNQLVTNFDDITKDEPQAGSYFTGIQDYTIRYHHVIHMEFCNGNNLYLFPNEKSLELSLDIGKDNLVCTYFNDGDDKYEYNVIDDIIHYINEHFN